MNISVAPGKYVVAVSGGVDSMVLLDLLAKEKDVELVVAHFDHGIRDDSSDDAEFVHQIATEKYNLPVEVGQAQLGADASEELARNTRYHYLEIVKKKHGASAIITAHHQDDFIETAIINILRGTGRLGLASLQSKPGMLRPLLDIPKEQLMIYAKEQNLAWREDSTNADPAYLRNKIRLQMLPKFSEAQKKVFLSHCLRVRDLNQQIATMQSEQLMYKSHRRERKVYKRYWFNALPHAFACEVVHHWLRAHDIHDYTHKKIDELVIRLKTTKAGKQIEVGKGKHLALTKRSIRLYL